MSGPSHCVKLTEFPEHMQPLIRDLLDRGLDIWLIGSRVNPTGEPPSDWDLIVFGSPEVLEEFSQQPPPGDLDLLVVTDGENFECPWPRPSDGVIKRGELTKWKWTPTSKTSATYAGTKWPKDWGDQKKAVLVER